MYRIALSLAICGCSDATAVFVVVDAQDLGRARGTTLTVRAFGPDGEVDPDPAELALDEPLPRVIRIMPRDADASRRWALRAILTDEAGEVLVESQLLGGFVAGAERFALLCLESSCFRPSCAGGGSCAPDAPEVGCQGCSNGACTLLEAELVPSAMGLECPPAPAPETFCGDGLDDDFDAEVDCADDDCEGRACDAQGRACVGTECRCLDATTETSCADAIDDDCDSAIDCDDPDCQGLACEADSELCTEDVCQGGTCAHPPVPNGRRCGTPDEACCDGDCRNMGTRHDCGGCNQSCGGRACHQIMRDGRARYMCNCGGSDFDCPNGQECASPLGPEERCQCTTDSTCSTGRCVNVPGDHNYCLW